jgi:heat shock protein HtpX
MGFGKRIVLFLLTNILVIAMISIIFHVFGIEPYITPYGLNYESLMIFCLVWGMGGAFISLALSKTMAKFGMGVKIIDPNTSDQSMQQIIQMVHTCSKGAGLSKMPEVGIFESPEPNAFATGATKNRSLVAVSTGLLQRMNRDEVEGVIGHEVAHIANGDMVTMALVQGVVNAFVMFLARAIAFAISNLGSRDRNAGGGMSTISYYITVFVLEMVFMILGSIVVAWFSRAREFRADEGGARLAGRDKMKSALQALQRNYEIVDPHSAKPAFNSMKISGHPSRFAALFSTHPPLSERIARLGT